MMINVASVLAALTPLVLLAADKPADGPDLEKLQGTWAVVRMESDGKVQAAEAVKDSTFVVKGSKYVLKGEETYQGGLVLDPAKKPKTIDATFVDAEGKEKGKALGIYELDGAKLKICWSDKGGERPTEFASKTGSGVRLMVFEKGR